MEAAYYEKEANGSVRCSLCPHHCHIAMGQYGFCQTRQNKDGTLTVLNYAACTSAALDPIEKKPLYCFHPGSRIFSVGSWGCNLTCAFCQNWEISQRRAASERLTPQRAAAIAEDLSKRGNIGIAYTYNEPTLSYEWILQTAPLIHTNGQYNVMVSNGYIEKEPLANLLPFIDAWNIDLKSYQDGFYQRLCQGTLAPVLQTIAQAAARSHVEVTTLIVTGENDTPEEMESLARHLAAIDRRIPLHLTRYFPRYRLQAPATPLTTLQTLRDVAKKYLDTVFLGNVPPGL